MMYTAVFDETNEPPAVSSLDSESLVRTFIWAQWDATNQVLYHIHNRRAPTSLVTEDDNESRSKTNVTSPTLSGLQFHDDLPHETVVRLKIELQTKIITPLVFTESSSFLSRIKRIFFPLLGLSDPQECF